MVRAGGGISEKWSGALPPAKSTRVPLRHTLVLIVQCSKGDKWIRRELVIGHP